MSAIADDVTVRVLEPVVDSAQPIAVDERIDALDLARGFALFGIAMMNVEWFERPIAGLLNGIDGSYTGIHLWIDRIIEWLIQGKFYPLFSLLFGMGFAVMLQRGEARSGAGGFIAIYARRLLALLAFGFIHGVLFYPGDILHAYALAGFALLIGYGLVLGIARLRGGRRLSTRWLLIIPLLFLLILPVFGNLKFAVEQTYFPKQEEPVAEKVETPAADAKKVTADAKTPEVKKEPEKTQEQTREEWRAKGQKAYDDARKTYQTGSWVEITKFRYSELMRQASLFKYFGDQVFLLFVLGSWFVFSGVLRDIAGHLPLFRKLAAYGLGLGIPLAAMPEIANMIDEEQVPLAMWGLFGAAENSSHLLLCVGYFAMMVLLAQSAVWARRLGFFSSVGRMALTHYILQSAIFSTIFAAYGLGMHGHMQRGPQILLAIAVFAIQVLISRWWLARYRFGPLEWVWRALTYLHAPKMLR